MKVKSTPSPRPKTQSLTIYILYIRSILDQSCVAWHGFLTEEKALDLERVHKGALRLIIGENHNGMGLEICKKYDEKFTKTNRLKNSSIQYMQRLLNSENLQFGKEELKER